MRPLAACHAPEPDLAKASTVRPEAWSKGLRACGKDAPCGKSGRRPSPRKATRSSSRKRDTALQQSHAPRRVGEVN